MAIDHADPALAAKVDKINQWIATVTGADYAREIQSGEAAILRGAEYQAIAATMDTTDRQATGVSVAMRLLAAEAPLIRANNLGIVGQARGTGRTAAQMLAVMQADLSAAEVDYDARVAAAINAGGGS